MKGFIEKDVSTRRKKTITVKSLWKMEKNMISTGQKISCPLARISYFRLFAPNSNNGFY